MQTSQQVAIIGAGVGGLASGRHLREFSKGRRRNEGLPLVGHYYGHSTIETVVRSARSAAAEILASPIPSGGR